MQTSFQEISDWLLETYSQTGFEKGVIAVSGGIDSAVALTLLTLALGPKKVYPILLPYADQNMSDARAIVKFNQIPEENINQINIQPAVSVLAKTVGLNLESTIRPGSKSVSSEEKLRLGNMMARSRMIILYDLAKKLSALVCGTENKSEKYLGYFTRFGDEASDIEPLQHLYKTEVRELAKELNLPDQFLSKLPSAELWSGQTDEAELGFNYELADQVLQQLIDKSVPVENIQIEGIAPELVEAIANRVKSNAYKQKVPVVM